MRLDAVGLNGNLARNGEINLPVVHVMAFLSDTTTEAMAMAAITELVQTGYLEPMGGEAYRILPTWDQEGHDMPWV